MISRVLAPRCIQTACSLWPLLYLNSLSAQTTSNQATADISFTGLLQDAPQKYQEIPCLNKLTISPTVSFLNIVAL